MRSEADNKIFLIKHNIEQIRDYCEVDQHAKELIKLISEKCAAIEKIKNTEVSQKSLETLDLLLNEVIAIRDITNPNSDLNLKAHSLIWLLSALESSDKKHHDSTDALKLAKFIDTQTEIIMKKEVLSQDEGEFKKDLSSLHFTSRNLVKQIEHKPMQLVNLNKVLLLTIQAMHDFKHLNNLQQEIKNHKLSIKDKIYDAFYKVLNKVLNHMSRKAYDVGIVSRPSIHRDPEPTFSLKNSNTQLFKKELLHTHASKVAKNIEKKNKQNFSKK